MTLYRQLLLFILLLLFTLLTGTWAAKLHSTRGFLMDQLASHAQDTATSLGLSISTLAADGDTAAMETMVNAVFDRGYYRQIVVRDLEERPLVERQLDVTVEGVPPWFVRLIPLETPSSTAFIMDGWKRLGSIFVHSHPGYAYQTLWRTIIDTTLWFLLAGAVVALAGSLALHLLLRPLKRVEHQALALCKRQYEIQEHLPKTRELRQVVEAMNRMTGKVRQMFDEQAAIAEQLRKNAYLDPLTGLGNRRYLEGQIASRLDAREATVKGAFLMLRIHGLERLNSERGLEAGDQLLLRVAANINRVAAPFARSAAGRLTGGDFALLLPDIDSEQARQCAATLSDSCAALHTQGLCLDEQVLHTGVVLYRRSVPSGELLALTDQALRSAQQEGPNRYHIQPMEGSGAPAASRSLLQGLLRQALQEKKISFQSQPAHRTGPGKEILHHELLARIPDDGNHLLPAHLFIPLAEQDGRITEFDRLMVEAVLDHAPGNLPGPRLALNLSPLSLADAAFREWLIGQLPLARTQGLLLDFECTEYSAVRHTPLLQEFAALLHRGEHRFGIDNFGQGLANFGYLHSLQPDYVKIERAFTNELNSEASDAYFFIGSLCAVAHSLDIQVIAKGVENGEQLRLLEELHVDGVQGYHFGQPENIS